MTSPVLDQKVFEALRHLQQYCYGSARERGFHDATDRLNDARSTEARGNRVLGSDYAKILDDAFRERAGNRLMLIVGEAAEAHEEIRKGNSPSARYYSVNPQDIPEGHPMSRDFSIVPGQGLAPNEADLNALRAAGVPLKPEGVPSEIADIVIRCLDFAGEHGIDLAEVIREKLEYNATRARMHGKKF